MADYASIEILPVYISYEEEEGPCANCGVITNYVDYAIDDFICSEECYKIIFYD